MKIAIIGCGSIGARHLDNIIGHCSEEYYRIGVMEWGMWDNAHFIEEKYSGTSKYIKIELFNDIEWLMRDLEPDAAIICLPTHLHVKFAQRLVSKGVPVLVEKPLSHSLVGVSKLANAASKTSSMMAMNYRFHPLIEKLRILVESNMLGRIYSVSYNLGQNLLTWPSGKDYADSYIARKDMGGGVTLTTLSHILDSTTYLFGDIIDVKCFVDKVSGFNIDTDDISIGTAKTKNGIYVSWNVDLMRKPRKNDISVVAERGSFVGNFYDASYDLHIDNDNMSGKFDFDFNDMYIKEMKYFLDCVKNNTKPIPNIKHGYSQLKLLLKITNNFGE